MYTNHCIVVLCTRPAGSTFTRSATFSLTWSCFRPVSVLLQHVNRLSWLPKTLLDIHLNPCMFLILSLLTSLQHCSALGTSSCDGEIVPYLESSNSTPSFQGWWISQLFVWTAVCLFAWYRFVCLSSLRPFQHVIMDFIELTPSEGKKYC